MNRCDFATPDGRKCLLPDDHSRKHMVSASEFTLEAAKKVIACWGFTSPDIHRAVEARFALGEVTAERFMALLKLATTLRTGIFGEEYD